LQRLLVRLGEEVRDPLGDDLFFVGDKLRHFGEFAGFDACAVAL
jgi:hypothetical protein